jgi:ornithine cyclodeaminase/alanine dehydrogenase-like protein (mu-crystallin family)
MLYLNSQEITTAVTCDEMMDGVEQAMEIYEDRAYTMPERMNVPCGDGNILLLMPCIAGDYMVTKVLTLYPGNRAVEKPVIQATVMLADSRTGTPLAIMDGGTITAMRTGAVSGSSIRHLAKADADSVGLVGCGVQGFYQLKYSCAARNIRKISLFDMNPENSLNLSEKFKSDYPDIEINIMVSTEDLINESDIIITATTARKPVLPDIHKLFKGKHCIAVGSFEHDVREYPDAVFSQSSKIWVDIDYAKEESGEILIPLKEGILKEEQIITLGQFIRSGSEPDRGESGTTFFKTVGMALFDLAAAQLIYQRAKDRGLGTVLD